MYTIETSRDQSPTLSVIGENNRKLYIHSRIAPLRDETLFASELEDADYDYIIMLGIGLGYQLAPLKQRETGSIILIDFLEQIETALEPIASSRWIVTQENITIFSGKTPEALSSLLDTVLEINEQTRLKILTHPASSRAFPGYYTEVKKVITNVIQNKAGNIATKKAFGAHYLRNSIKKIPFLDCFAPVAALEDSCEKLPALVISSAPSLDREIEWIAQHHDCFILVAVDSALPVLQKYAISPDFFVTIDPQPWINEHFMQSCIQESFGITTLSAWNVPLDPKQTYLSSNTHPFAQALEHYCGHNLGSIDSRTGNVAGDAINAALFLGCDPVYIVGADFSFPRFSIYARGTAYQYRYASLFNNRFKPVETCNADYIVASSKKLRVQGRFTRHSFIQYHEKLSAFLASLQNRNIIHVTSEGIPINNIPCLSSLCELGSDAMQPIEKHLTRETIHRKTMKSRQWISREQLKSMCRNHQLMEQVLEHSLAERVYQEKRTQLLSRIAHAVDQL